MFIVPPGRGATSGPSLPAISAAAWSALRHEPALAFYLIGAPRLVAGVPAFHIEELELRDAADRLWWRLELHEPVAENPLLTFELDQRPPGQLWLQGRDNNGNLIRHEVQA